MVVATLVSDITNNPLILVEHISYDRAVIILKGFLMGGVSG